MTRDVLIQVSQPAAAPVRRTSCFFKDIAAEWSLPTFSSPSQPPHARPRKQAWMRWRRLLWQGLAAWCCCYCLSWTLAIITFRGDSSSKAKCAHLPSAAISVIGTTRGQKPFNVLSNLVKWSQRHELSSPAAVTLPYPLQLPCFPPVTVCRKSSRHIYSRPCDAVLCDMIV